MAVCLLLLDQDGETVVVDEDESAFLIGTFEDELAQPITTLLSLTLTLMEKSTRKVINNRLNDNILLSFSGGSLRHELTADDNPIILATTEEGATELHLVQLDWSWLQPGGATGTATQFHQFPVRRAFVPVP